MDIDIFFKGLSDIFAAGEISEVSGYLRDALAAAEAEGDNNAAVTILNEMIGYFRSVSAYPEAIDASRRALSLMREMGYADSVPFGTTLLNAATAYRASGHRAQALDFFRQALAIFRGQLPDDDPRLAGLYNNLSAIHQENGDLEQARDALERAAAIMAGLGDLAIDLATVYTNLALVLEALRQPEASASALNRAMAIFEREGASAREDGRKAPHFAAALAGFAAARYRMGQYAEAIQMYTEVMERIKECFGENRDYAVTCRNCAEVCEAAGYSEKARELRERADAIWRRLGLAGNS